MTGAAPERALLLGDDLGVFLAIARSLGRRGIEVHIIPAEEDSPALASRYIRRIHSLPAYLAGPAGWASALRSLIDAHDFRLIIPSSDQGVALLDRHADELGRTRLALPNPEALAAFADKGATRALATDLGIPVARGCTVGAGIAADELGRRLGLPLVLKPARSYRPGERSAKTPARIVRTAEELGSALGAVGEGWLAESFFPGEGAGVSVVADRGQVLLAAQHRRLATLSETGGSSVRITEPLDPRLLRQVERLAAAVSLTGPAMFEFRRDRATGAHILLEVNARFWGSLPLALSAGADFPALAWDVFTGALSAPAQGARPGIVRTNMTGEFDRCSDALNAARGAAGRAGAALSLLAFLPGLAFPARFDSWAADDPSPFRAERRAILARIAGRLAGVRRRATSGGGAALRAGGR